MNENACLYCRSFNLLFTCFVLYAGWVGCPNCAIVIIESTPKEIAYESEKK